MSFLIGISSNSSRKMSRLNLVDENNLIENENLIKGDYSRQN